MPAKRAPEKPTSTRRSGSGRRLDVILDASLSRFAYRCWPDGCPRDRTCCIGLAVEVSRREIRAIDSMMDELASLVPALAEDDGYASVFVDDPPEWIIETDDDGVCPFLMRTRTRALCSIHHQALATGRHVPDWKPAACRHWPLMLQAEGSRVRISVQPSARRIGCIAPRAELPGQPSVLEAYRSEIEEIRSMARLPRARATLGARVRGSAR
ncbi:MAG: hypothetical protein FJ144_11665 [Deltaproteobacteria bacterium]|nr:hypothetical protein [Deltaproteobacteria bacterium]